MRSLRGWFQKAVWLKQNKWLCIFLFFVSMMTVCLLVSLRIGKADWLNEFLEWYPFLSLSFVLTYYLCLVLPSAATIPALLEVVCYVLCGIMILCAVLASRGAKWAKSVAGILLVLGVLLSLVMRQYGAILIDLGLLVMFFLCCRRRDR